MDEVPIDLDAPPPAGGRWIRNPDTGALTPVDEHAPTPEAPAEQE